MDDGGLLVLCGKLARLIVLRVVCTGGFAGQYLSG